MVVSSGKEEIGSGEPETGRRVGRAIGETAARVNATGAQFSSTEQRLIK
jgi:hypothetical protein